MKNPDNLCKPSLPMSSTNAYDAKKECDRIPNCYMFYEDSGFGLGKYFRSCENTAFVVHHFVGYRYYNLYLVLSGNENIYSMNILEIYHKGT